LTSKDIVKKPRKKPVKKSVKELDAEAEAKRPKRKNNFYTASKYNTDMGYELIDILSKGDSRAHFCDRHNISYKTFDNWRVKYPEFQLAYDVAYAKCERWWKDVARNHLSVGKEDNVLNHIVWSMNMRNRFGWTEHRKTKVAGIDKAETFSDQYRQVVIMLANGELTADEAVKISKLIETGVKVNEATELEARVADIEKAQAIGFGDDEFTEEKE
jgi:hypothetical protein